jgi:hypothetical protein
MAVNNKRLSEDPQRLENVGIDANSLAPARYVIAA